MDNKQENMFSKYLDTVSKCLYNKRIDTVSACADNDEGLSHEESNTGTDHFVSGTGAALKASFHEQFRYVSKHHPDR